MVNSNSPRGAEAARGGEPVGGVGHATCGVVGLALAAAALAVAYPFVVAVANVLPLLSTTAVALFGVFVWLGLWFAFDVALGQWRTRRGQGVGRLLDR